MPNPKASSRDTKRGIAPLVVILMLVVSMLAWGSGGSTWLHHHTAHGCQDHHATTVTSVALVDEHACLHSHEEHTVESDAPLQSLAKQPEAPNQNKDAEDDDCGLCHLLASAIDQTSPPVGNFPLLAVDGLVLSNTQTRCTFRAAWPEVRGPPSIA